MIIKDKLGENWIQIKSKEIHSNAFYYYIMDFKSNTTTVIAQNYLGIIVPKQMIEEADGLVINGFPGSDSDDQEIDRKKRSVGTYLDPLIAPMIV